MTPSTNALPSHASTPNALPTGTPRESTRSTGRLAAVLAVSGALLLPVAVPTLAASAVAHEQQQEQQHDARTGDRVLAEARTHEGKPYEYGATGPGAFDCSGYVQYVFRQVGVEVPRTSRDQYAAAQKVAKADRRPGDLIAMKNSRGRVTHVGIYAGSDRWWVASSGKGRIMLQTLYSSSYGVGRLA